MTSSTPTLRGRNKRRLMLDWARFAGFAALLSVALGGSLLWALDYTSQNGEWTCQSQAEPGQPENRAADLLVCQPAHSNNLQPPPGSADAYRDQDDGDSIKITNGSPQSSQIRL